MLLDKSELHRGISAKMPTVGSTVHRNMSGFVMLKEASKWRAPGAWFVIRAET
jgi:hypothetical protein